MSLQAGTSLFLLTTVGLSLPSLISQNYHKFNLSSPLLSHSFVSQHLFFSYTIASHKSLPLINNTSNTWITYMFNHADINHFLGNAFSIVTSTIALDLGFMRLLLLFYGGGIAGILSHMLEMSLRSHEWNFSLINGFLTDTIQPAFNFFDQSLIFVRLAESIETVRRNLPLPSRKFILCGSSAGVFSLMGAEVYLTTCELVETWRLIRNYSKSRNTKEGLYSRFSRLLVGLLGRAVMIASQVYMMLDQKQMGAKAFIGHSAHIGGFAFGIVAMSLLNRSP